MRPIRSASVLMPTWQAMEFLERVLDALAAQRTSLPWDLHVIDSGSTDGTFECLQQRRSSFPVPFSVRRIPPVVFDHGDTRNQLAALSRGDLLVFLTQDAIPSAPDWLDTLARNFRDPRVGGAYCRNVPREDCWVLTRVACAQDPGYATERREERLPPARVYAAMDAESRRRFYNFNDVASALRRELWERHPFPRTMMGEDMLMGRALLEAGFTVVYDARATVDHSHDYEPPKQRWRGEVDARFNAEWLDRICVARAGHVPVLVERAVAADLAGLAAAGFSPVECASLEPRARELRRALFQGMYEGSQAQRRYPRTTLRATGRLRLMISLSGGAQDDEAARCSLELGREWLERGHHVTLVSLVQDPLHGPFLQRAQAHGLNALEVRTGDDAAGDGGLARLLADEAPDVLFLCGLGPRTARLARVAWECALPYALLLQEAGALGAGDPGAIAVAAAADQVLVPSLALRAALLAGPLAERMEPRRVVPLAFGIDAREQHRRPKTADPRVRFGYFGPLAPEGGLATVIRALACLPSGSAVLRVHVTDPALPIDVASDAPSGAVEWVRGYAARDLGELLAEVDVLVSGATAFGGWDRAVALARLHRTAVIAGRGYGADELVEDGVHGLTFPAGDEGALAAAMSRFVQEPGLGERLAHGAEDGPTLADCAAELEYRLRAMACLGRERVLPERVVLDLLGRELLGPQEFQREDLILLGPGSEARVAVDRVPPGPVALELERVEFGVEPGLTLASTLRLDGRPFAVIPPSKAARRSRRARKWLTRAARLGARLRLPWPLDRTRQIRLRTWIAPGARWLSIDPGNGFERIAHLRIRSFSPPADPQDPRPMRGDPLSVAEALRVRPGPAVSTAELPGVTVVIPTFEGWEVLPTCLASLAAARYPKGRVRVIVVDNGSGDGTSEHLRREHPGVRVVMLGRNLGFAAACNAGARAAEGTGALVFLNNDMRVDPEFLVELVSPLVRGECSATVAKRLSWDGTRLDGAGVGSTFAGIAVQPGFGAPPGPEHDVPRRALFPCGGAMAIDPGVFAASGGFDEEFFAYYEDLDLGWRLWILGHATHYVPAAVAYHHHSHTSKRLPQAALRRAMIRNPLLTCVKNYEEEHLARVLPVLLALATRRAALAAQLDGVAPRLENAGTADLAPSGERALDGGTTAIGSLGVADLAAIDDLLGRWPHWLERRRAVQARRLVPDREIFPMFLEPLACVEGDPGYRDLQRELVERYRLAELFTPSD